MHPHTDIYIKISKGIWRLGLTMKQNEVVEHKITEWTVPFQNVVGRDHIFEHMV